MRTFRLIHESGVRALCRWSARLSRAPPPQNTPLHAAKAYDMMTLARPGPKPLLCLNRLWAARRSWTAHHLQASARAMATSSRLRLRIWTRASASTRTRSCDRSGSRSPRGRRAWATCSASCAPRATRRCPTASACGSRCATTRTRARAADRRRNRRQQLGVAVERQAHAHARRCSAAAPRPPRSAATGRSATTPAAAEPASSAAASSPRASARATPSSRRPWRGAAAGAASVAPRGPSGRRESGARERAEPRAGARARGGDASDGASSGARGAGTPSPTTATSTDRRNRTAPRCARRRARVPAWARGERLAGALDRQQRATPPPRAAPPDATPPPPEVDLDAIFGRAVPTSAERRGAHGGRARGEAAQAARAVRDRSSCSPRPRTGPATPPAAPPPAPIRTPIPPRRRGGRPRGRGVPAPRSRTTPSATLPAHYAKYNGMPGRERELELVQRVDGDDDALHGGRVLAPGDTPADVGLSLAPSADLFVRRRRAPPTPEGSPPASAPACGAGSRPRCHPDQRTPCLGARRRGVYVMRPATVALRPFRARLLFAAFAVLARVVRPRARARRAPSSRASSSRASSSRASSGSSGVSRGAAGSTSACHASSIARCGAPAALARRGIGRRPQLAHEEAARGARPRRARARARRTSAGSSARPTSRRT